MREFDHTSYNYQLNADSLSVVMSFLMFDEMFKLKRVSVVFFHASTRVTRTLCEVYMKGLFSNLRPLVAAKCRRLRVLDLGDGICRSKQNLKHLILLNPNLESLSIGGFLVGCTNSNQKECESSLVVCIGYNLPKLREFKWVGCIQTAGLLVLQENCPKLRHLEIRCGVEHDKATMHEPFYAPTASRSHLKYAGERHRFTLALTRWLKDEKCPIKILKMAGIYSIVTVISDEVIAFRMEIVGLDQMSTKLLPRRVAGYHTSRILPCRMREYCYDTEQWERLRPVCGVSWKMEQKRREMEEERNMERWIAHNFRS